MIKPWIYIDHIPADGDDAERIRRDLEKEGFHVWRSNHYSQQVKPGDRRRDAREIAIKNAWCVVVVCSPARTRRTLLREFFHRFSVLFSMFYAGLISPSLEVERYGLRGKPLVIPVRVAPCELPMSLKDIEPADLFDSVRLVSFDYQPAGILT